MAEAQVASDSLDIVDSMTSIQFDTEREVLRATYDSSRDSPCLAVVAVVATVDNGDVFDLAPLESVIDTDALENLFSGTATGDRRSAEVTFTYEGCDVTVSNHGLIEVKPISPA